ncbi:MAG TPA: LysR substrate-binding domain-containing protein, partial [Candidatus Acidoferrales bacterium]|nr:LysR substrate-binding domain-containing protein [Candidatus Acidoferrales bacterium]
MPDLNALVIFAKVVEAQSFSAGARRLQMPLSTVSRRVAELEAGLGVRLLDRNTRRIRLTPMGAEVYAQAKVSVDVNETVAALVNDLRGDLSGVLRLAAPPSISDSLLVPLISGFQEGHPGVRVQVFITGRFVDLVEEGVDVAFFVKALPRDASLVSHRILRYRHRLVAAPAHVAGYGDPANPDELLERRIFAFSFWNDWGDWTLTNVRTGESRTLNFRPALSMNDYVGLSEALLAGCGIGDLPPIVQPRLISEGRLVEVMREWHFPIYDFMIAYLGNRNI